MAPYSIFFVWSPVEMDILQKPFFVFSTEEIQSYGFEITVAQ